MIRKRKRLWALLLSVVLIATQFPAVAMAENNMPDGASGYESLTQTTMMIVPVVTILPQDVIIQAGSTNSYTIPAANNEMNGWK